LTDWAELGPGIHQGIGQHVFQVGNEDVGILEIREAVFNSFEVEKKDESGN
jgi:protein involved in temperature-dependent protein secretion